MTTDLTTDLLRRYAGPMSPRRADAIMKTLDRALIQLFPAAQRSHLQQLMPGMAGRRMGARFGLKPKALRSESVLTWDKAIEKIRHELRVTHGLALDLIDAYLKAHLVSMTARARLSLTEASPDDLVRAYLRALED